MANHSGKQAVSFIKIEKHQPTRKNINGKLLFWNKEESYDYRYSKYLEQNRYNRLFDEQGLLGQGGFGKVFKVQHVLDQRQYAIKQIEIHLGINQDFNKHSVYREIVAISQVLHKNVVRYHACWIESKTPSDKLVSQVVKKVEYNLREKFKNRREAAKKLECYNSPFNKCCNKKKKGKGLDIKELLHSSVEDISKGNDSILDLDKVNQKNTIGKGLIKNPRRSSSLINQHPKVSQKWQGKNLLKIIEDENDLEMNEDWANQNESSDSSILSCFDQNKKSETS